MADKPPAGRDGGGRGRGGGRGGRGKGGRGRGGRGGKKDGSKEGGDGGKAAAKNNSPKESNTPGGGRSGNKGGRGGGEGRGGDVDGNKNSRRRNNNNANSKGRGKGGKGGGKGQEKAPAPPQKSEEERKREEDERKSREEAELLKKRQEAEQKALAAAREKRLKAQEALDLSVKEAMESVKAMVDAIHQHKINRGELEAETLAAFRKNFQSNKKSLKTDLKKCTAFVKKIKSGTAWTMKVDEINRDVSTLNLSRYVDEVVSALLDAKFKVPDLPQVVALSKAMHLRYEEFLSNLLPGLWSVVNSKKIEDAKNRRLFVRLVTDFVLNGLVTDTKPLLKLIGEATGGKDGNFAVTDANGIVAFGKAAGFEIFNKKARSLQDQVALIERESAKAKAVLQAIPVESTEGETSPADGAAEKFGPVVVPMDLANSAMAVVAQVEEKITDLAVPPAISEVFTDYCVGSFQTLSSSLVSTHVKLQKLEKRCEQDRLLSGTLPEAREKGLTDARKLLESLQKSVDSLADVLDQPLPHLEEDDNEDEDAGGGGLELWTKGGGDGENGDDFGPFDDEETRAFYCDIPDLLTTVPPGLLGISMEAIERRKADNAQKYGSGFDEETVEGEGETVDEVFSVEDHLEADEELVIGEQAAGEEAEGRSWMRENLMCYYEGKLTFCVLLDLI